MKSMIKKLFLKTVSNKNISIILFFITLSLSLLLFTSNSYAQTVFEPVQSSVYDFLDRMAQKGIIEFSDIARPVSRKYIAEKLEEISDKLRVTSNEKEYQLTGVEKEDLYFYLKDFGMELKEVSSQQSEVNSLNEPTTNHQSAYVKTSSDTLSTTDNLSQTTLLNWDPYGRWRMFSYEDSLFKLNADPILGYQAGKRDGAKYSHSWNGVYLYGYIADKIGYSLRFNDNSENGTTIDRTKNFTPITGVSITKADNNNIQYDQVEANIATDWSWGDAAIGKDFLNWGYGRSGLLVLSDKSPSFPYIRLDIHPVKWLHFNYIHAWLNSNVIDSTSDYATLQKNTSRTIFRDKYFVSHSITVTPETGLDLSIGESMIYADKLEIPYLIPIMFFRLADHYLSQNSNNAGGNASFFFGVSSRNQLKNTHLYGTLFIDEFTIENVFNSQKQHMQIGFTLGGSVTDLPIDNLTLTAEFTKIYPGVYTHYIPTLTYQSNGYDLGDWMGNNADRIYGALDYRLIHGLTATLWGQYVRKGATATADQQYTNPQPPFLFGLRTNYSYLGANVSYEITHDFSAKLQIQTTKISTQQADLSFSDHRLNEFYVSLEYGIL